MVSTRTVVPIALLAVATLLASAACVSAQSFRSVVATSPSIRFTENRGQIIDMQGEPRPDIRFVAGSGDVHVFLRSTGISYVFTRRDNLPDPVERSRPDLTPARRFRLDSISGVTGYRMDVEFVGAQPPSRITTEGRSGDYANFYLPHCPDGITGVRSFDRVIYHDIYPDIDLVLRGADQGMKYDFVVRPGGRVSDIRLRYIGADSMQLTRTGALRVANPLGSIEEGKPLTYQQTGSASIRNEISSSYRRSGDVITFDVKGYNRMLPLVIDPTLTWGTYIGGDGVDYMYNLTTGAWGGGQSIAVVPGGGVVVAATSSSTNFPTTVGAFQTSLAGAYDACLVRINGDGMPVWGTYFGGSSSEYGHGVAISGGSIYHSGTTSSSNLPVSSSPFQGTFAGGSWDSYVLRLDSNGIRTWATYFGGTGWDCNGGIAADTSGNVVISGMTTSSGLASVGAAQTSGSGGWDSYITKFSPAGVRLWTTYFGGSGDEYYGSSLCTDRRGTIILCGATSSTNLPVTTGAYQGSIAGGQDIFLAKFSSAGTRLWATYLGGSNHDYAGSVIADLDSNIILCGYSNSSTFPTTSGATQTTMAGNGDGIIVKFNSAGVLRWSTFQGGYNYDWLSGIATDSMRNILLTGQTQSNNFPVTADAYQNLLGGSYDAVIVKLDSSGRRDWSSYLGGTQYDWGDGVAVDRNAIYLSGSTMSTNFPVTPGAFRTTNSGGYDLFLSKFCDITPTVLIHGSRSICPGDSVVLSAIEGFDSYRWSNGATTRSITVTQEGDYYVTASIGACSGGSDTTRIEMYRPVRPKVSPSNSVFCDGDSVTISIPEGYVSQRWSNGATSSHIVARTSGMYFAEVIDSNGCRVRSDTTTVVVNPLPSPVVAPGGVLSLCAGDTIELDAGPGYRDYLWSTFETTRKIRVGREGVYSVRVTNQQFCSATSAAVTVKRNPRPDSTVIQMRPLDFCYGDSTIVAARPGYRYKWSTGATTQLVTIRESGLYTLTVTDSAGCSSSSQFRVQVTPPMWQAIHVNRESRIICQGDSIELDAGANQKSYRWSNGETTQRITVRRSGAYSVRFESQLGCVGTSDTVHITVQPRPQAVINGPVEVCAGTATIYSVPEREDVQYHWKVNGAGGTITSGAGTAQIVVRWGPSGTGTVGVTVTDNVTACMATSETGVTVGNAIKPVIVPDRTPLICPSDSITLDAGPGYAAYRWSTGATTRRITVAEPQPYLVTVTDTEGCSGSSDPLVVRISSEPVPVIAPLGPTSFCNGESVTLDAGQHSEYLWSTGELTRTIVARQTGAYFVTVTDSLGCQGTSPPVTVSVNALPTPTIDGPNSVCADAVAQYQAPATANDFYQWSVSGGEIIAGQGTPTATIRWNAASQGTIDLTQTSGTTGCSSIAGSYTVKVGSTLSPMITVNKPGMLCRGDSITLTAPANYESYEWSNGARTRSITVGDAGSYSVQVTGSGGCSGESEPVTVTVFELPSSTIAAEGPTTFCEGDSLVLTAPEGFPYYRWSNGVESRTITVKSPGDYFVEVTSPEGCSAFSEPITVKVTPVPMPPTIIRNGDTLRTSIASARYQWSHDGRPIPGATGPDLIATAPGTYQVVITNTGGCSARSAAYRISAERTLDTVALDTVSANVGDRFLLTMSITPPLTVDDAVDSYRFRLRVNRLALYTLGIHVPAATGNGPAMSVTKDGVITIERTTGGDILTGSELFQLELQGLITGQPVNDVIIEEAMIGNRAASMAFDGRVLLSGCAVGTLELEKVVAIRSVRPNPVDGEAVIVYRAPVGSTPQLVVTDMAGRVIISRTLPEGTGEEQEERLGAYTLASGLYRFELRDRAERSIVPVVVVR